MERSIYVKRLSDSAITPKKTNIGYELFASSDCMIPAFGKNAIALDISILIPEGYFGRNISNHILSWKHTTVHGMIEPNSNRSISIIMFNHSNLDILITTHDKVAYLVLEKIIDVSMHEI